MIRKIVDLLSREVDVTVLDRWLVGVLSFRWLAGNGESKISALLSKEVGFPGLWGDSPPSYHELTLDRSSDYLEVGFDDTPFGTTHAHLNSQSDSDNNLVSPFSISQEFEPISASFSDSLACDINPANGLPMVTETLDIGGNAYGTSGFD